MKNPSPWNQLTQFTAARIALGRSGISLPTREILNFGLAHAKARDAVHTPLNVDLLTAQLTQAGFNAAQAHSQAKDRATYLQRPDLGRALYAESEAELKQLRCGRRLAVVIADGLSACAVQRHALPVLIALRGHGVEDWSEIPVVIANQGRVAIGDAIGAALCSDMVLVLIGERPGLSSPDSLGAYLTYSPRPGRTDAERNCVSNIRPEGLDYPQAAFKIKWLIETAQRLQLSGVALKDESEILRIN